jgi:hypothetical protein
MTGLRLPIIAIFGIAHIVIYLLIGLQTSTIFVLESVPRLKVVERLLLINLDT